MEGEGDNRDEGNCYLMIFYICRIGRRKSILSSSVLSIIVTTLIIASPNVETYIFFRALHQTVDFGYYVVGLIMCKLHLTQYVKQSFSCTVQLFIVR